MNTLKRMVSLMVGVACFSAAAAPAGYQLVWAGEFDGEEVRRETNSICHGAAPVFLSSAIIKWAGEVTDKIDDTVMEVDYVRIYEAMPHQVFRKTPNETKH